MRSYLSPLFYFPLVGTYLKFEICPLDHFRRIRYWNCRRKLDSIALFPGIEGILLPRKVGKFILHSEKKYFAESSPFGNDVEISNFLRCLNEDFKNCILLVFFSWARLDYFHCNWHKNEKLFKLFN